MSSDPSGSYQRPNKVLNRAFAIGAAFSAATAIVTGVFINKVSEAYAATHRSTSVTTNNRDGSANQTPNNPTGNSPQLSVPQQNQLPVGGSNGS